MFKKIFIVIMALLPFVAKAQQAVGSWTFYPSFSTASKIVETEDKVYYVSSGSLFSFDKTTEERMSLNGTTGLNDMVISDIFYNPFGNYLLVCYNNGNMDKVYDDGKIVNLPDISNATLTTTPSVKAVAFGKDAFYVLTNFGLVNYDDRKNEVRATCYTTDIQSVMCQGKYVIANISDKLHYAPMSERITSIEKFSPISNYSVAFVRLKMLGTTSAGFYSHGPLTGFKVDRIIINDDATCAISELQDPTTNQPINAVTDIVANPDGSVNLISKDKLYRVATDGTVSRYNIPANLQGQTYSAADGATAFWCSSAEGIGEFDITQNPAAVKHDRFLGSELSVINPRFLTPAQNGSFIVAFRFLDYWENYQNRYQPFQMNIISNGQIKNITPPYNDVVKSRTDGMRVVQHPTNPDLYMVTGFFSGITRIQNGQYDAVFNSTNAPFPSSNLMGDIAFDRHGNLWATTEAGAGKSLVVLPADKVALPMEQISKEDWVIAPIEDELFRTSRFYVCQKSNYIFFARAWYGNKFTVCDTKGTASLTDDEFITVEKLYDQDNNELNDVLTYTEDKDGNIFIAGENYVANLGRPGFSSFTKTMQVNRIKIPRNDGTNLADYLADGQRVFGISTDGANNKWLATSGGIIEVNSSNDKILEWFTTDNSPMSANTVFAVGADPNSNSIWFAGNGGLMEYSSSSSPGSNDYSEVLAYPNPVRPDYTGWVTVKNLMNNSLVKIADAYGNVVAQGRSNGGMYLWDVCNTAGERVTSGVYYVFASQNENGSSGAVAKILVVN